MSNYSSCLVSSQYSLQCLSAVGGLSKVYLGGTNQIKLLSQNRGLTAFAETMNGEIYALGLELGGGYLSAGTGASGAAMGDSNQYSITLTFYSKSPMMLLDDTLPNVVSGISIVG